jgi:hypothetical protein
VVIIFRAIYSSALRGKTSFSNNNFNKLQAILGREKKIFTGKDKSIVKTSNIQISEILLPENIQTTQHMTFFEQQEP